MHQCGCVDETAEDKLKHEKKRGGRGAFLSMLNVRGIAHLLCYDGMYNDDKAYGTLFFSMMTKQQVSSVVNPHVAHESNL